MPLPTDEKTVEISKDVVKTLQGIFGPHPGFRPGPLESRSLSKVSFANTLRLQ